MPKTQPFVVQPPQLKEPEPFVMPSLQPQAVQLTYANEVSGYQIMNLL